MADLTDKELNALLFNLESSAHWLEKAALICHNPKESFPGVAAKIREAVIAITQLRTRAPVSAPEVEAMAKRVLRINKIDLLVNQEILDEAATMLRALARERDELRAENAQLKLKIAILTDPEDEPSAGDYECTR